MKDIALHIMDIAQNSVSAGATVVKVSVIELLHDDLLHVVISDNGKGMDKETVDRVTDPYYTTRTTRKVGMGIPLLKHNAEQAEGKFTISSVPGKGTELNVSFRHSHIDRPPEGDIAGVISLLAGANPEMDFVYRHAVGEAEYVFDTREVKEILEDVPLSMPAVIKYMKELIEENVNELRNSRKQ